jgi:hypothetical protein
VHLSLQMEKTPQICGVADVPHPFWAYPEKFSHAVNVFEGAGLGVANGSRCHLIWLLRPGRRRAGQGGVFSLQAVIQTWLGAAEKRFATSARGGIS